ncbi:MAG: MFS transporter [Oscillospiraceae bacterium]|nr:MFS transporter [Oscillospiraceae bacterium]
MTPGPETKKEKLLSKDYIIIMCSSLCVNIYTYAFIATLPPYMLFITGRAFYAGIITSVYSLTALAVRPAAGVFSDRIGRVKLLISGALICSAAAFGFAFTTSVIMLIVLRMISGIGFGLHSTCGGAAAADVLPKSRLAEGIGYFGLYSTVGQMTAPALALAIVAGGTAADYKNLFFFGFFIAGAGMIFACFLTYERRRRKSEASAAPASSGREKPSGNAGVPAGPLPKTILGFEYAVFKPGVVLLIMFFGIASILSYITVFAELKGFGNSGLYFTFSALGVLFSRLLLGKVVDKRGADVVVIPAAAMLACLISLIPTVNSMTALAALAVPIGISQGALLPTMNQMMFRRCSPQRRGTASGAYYCAVDLGIVIGSPILGAVADAADIRFSFWLSSVWILIALTVYILFCTDKRYSANLSQNKPSSADSET